MLATSTSPRAFYGIYKRKPVLEVFSKAGRIGFSTSWTNIDILFRNIFEIVFIIGTYSTWIPDLNLILIPFVGDISIGPIFDIFKVGMAGVSGISADF